MPVSKGLATYAGLIAAVGQYMGAVALFMEADDPLTGLGPLGTATVTLVTVIAGRMWQAGRSSWGAPQRRSQHVPSEAEIGAWPTTAGSTGSVTWNEPRPGVAMTNTVQGEFDREPDRPHPDELRDLHDGEIT